MYHFNLRRNLFGLIALLLSACTSATQFPAQPLVPYAISANPPPPEFVGEITANTLPMLVVAEREASTQGNLPLLAKLWAENGRIVDGRGSVEADDDYVWEGRAAILDRYQMAVFPAPPPLLPLAELTDAIVTVDGATATLINGGDRWRFVLQNGRWWLQELTYGVPIAQE